MNRRVTCCARTDPGSDSSRQRRKRGFLPFSRSKFRATALILIAWACGFTIARGQDAPVDNEEKPAASRKSDTKRRKEQKDEHKPLYFEMKKTTVLHAGDWLQVKPTVRLQTDFQFFQPGLAAEQDLFSLKRARVGIDGELLKRFTYQVEGELRSVSHRWKDVYINYRFSPALQLRAGKFKIPFGQDQLTSVADLDFVARSRAGDHLAPGRDVGVMAHGRLFGALNYQAGVFRHDGEGTRSGESAVAARLHAAPFKALPIPFLRNLDLGAAVTSSRLAEGSLSTEGLTSSGLPFFSPLFVRGRRLRAGVEAGWNSGPFSLHSEFIQVRDDRLGQGVRQEDLPSLLAQGWHLSGSWTLTGEKKKEESVQPERDFLVEGGFGALELAARYERALFAGSRHPGRASHNPRAASVVGNGDQVWTLGLNWYLNRYLKVQFDAMRDHIEDSQPSPDGEDRFWMQILRIQLAF